MVTFGLHVSCRAKQESNTFQGKQTPTVTEKQAPWCALLGSKC